MNDKQFDELLDILGGGLKPVICPSQRPHLPGLVRRGGGIVRTANKL
jgi:hypothetical protein